MLALEKYNLKNLELKNRIVMPPMCMYSSDTSGKVKNFHHTHYEARAMGGVGLIILEATGVSPNGRISMNDLGLWSDEHILGLKRLVSNIKKWDTRVAIQLNHAGRKAILDGDLKVVGPSPLAYDENHISPNVLSKEDIHNIIRDFRNAAIRANEIGFDALEIHAAHGYLIHQFLSPLSNKRKDAYGDSLVNRTRFLKEVLSEVKRVWPSSKPIFLRVSASDYLNGGITVRDMVEIINQVKPYIDIVHVSSGGLVPADIDVYPGYQVDYSAEIKKSCNIPTIAVGLINNLDYVEEILESNKSDLVALGRLLLREPNFILNSLYKRNIKYEYPNQYERAYRF